MPTPQTIPVPMPRDKRVLHLAKSLGLPNRTAWAMTGECWQWLLDEAHGDRVEATDVELLDGVASCEGFGRAMLEAGLVGTVDNALVLPQELARRTAQDRTDTNRRKSSPDAKPTKGALRQRKYRQKKKASTNTNDTAKKVSAKQGTLGQVAGCTVKVLTNRNGQRFYKAVHASPDLTGSVTDDENPNLLDALLAFADTRMREAKRQPGVQMTPSAEELALEAERLLSVAQSVTVTHCDAVTRNACQGDAEVASHAASHSVTHSDATARKSLKSLDLSESVERHAERHSSVTVTRSEGVTPPSSSSVLDRIKKETTTSTAATESVNAQHARVNQILQRAEPIKHTPVIKTPEAIAAEERVQRIAAALDISPGSARAQEKGAPGDLARRLRERGYDRDGFEIKKDGDAAPGVTPPPESEEAVNSQEDVVTKLETGWLAKKELQDTSSD
jgi:hypothetical protein